MNIDDLICDVSRGSAWVDHEDFDSLYVRVGKKYINENYHDTIDIANVTSNNPGNGNFLRLIKYLKNTYPTKVIHVENVLENRFEQYLLKIGFMRVNNVPICFWLPIENGLLC